MKINFNLGKIFKKRWKNFFKNEFFKEWFKIKSKLQELKMKIIQNWKMRFKNGNLEFDKDLLFIFCK